MVIEVALAIVREQAMDDCKKNGLPFSVSLYILIYLSDEFWSHTSPIFALFSPTPLFSPLFLLLANSLYLQEPLIGQNSEEKTKNFCLLMGKTQSWLPPAKELL